MRDTNVAFVVEAIAMTQKQLSAYIASPYGFAESTREFYYGRILPLVGRYFNIIDPWSVDVQPILTAPPHEQPDAWLNHGDYHFDCISKLAALVVACLDQEPPDNGTVVEISWAAAHNIPVIGYRGDVRTTGERGLDYNLMIGAAIRRSGGATARSLAELELELQHQASKL